ncbi:MAG: hypothetical protein FJ265_05925 [Planctomycetes bacterium]|nr:hypothetical protein [Planctomycetota bacterium]
MTAEPQRDDQPEFLDDFVLEEDAVAGDDDLDALFASPVAPAPAAVPAATAEPAGPAAPVEDDILFQDHTAGLQPTEQFGEEVPFAEQGKSAWSGEGLELESAGGAPAPAGEPAGEFAELLASEDELALDSEKELEIVGGAAEAAAEPAAEVPTAAAAESDEVFVIDDGTLQEAVAGAAGAGAELAAGAEPVELEADAAPLEAADGVELVEASEGAEAVADALEPGAVAAELAVTDAGEPAEDPGWEPLPGTSMDELAEVQDVARTDGEESAAEAEPAALAAVGAATEQAEIYATNEADPVPAVVGGRRGRRRGLRLLGSLVASAAVLAAAAIVVLQPAWFGLRFEPEAVTSAQVQRPRIEVALPIPPAPVAAPGEPVVEPKPPEPQAEPKPPAPGSEQPDVPAPAPDKVPQVVTTEPAGGTGPGPTVPGPVVPPQDPPAAATAPVVVPPAAAPDPGWPVAHPGAQQPPAGASAAGSPPLQRFGESLLVGAGDPEPARPVEGMLPGSRAFAQLRNGNYFIGSVKHADRERITLRVGTGEVTLQVASLAKLTELGSADYEELQKVSSGFVRLTNNNRLVGSILSSIADDHIVLEFRSNRVMLPKSAVGEVVPGESEATVRLGTTREEEDWLRQLVERQLGTGAAPIEARPGATPPAGQRGAK